MDEPSIQETIIGFQRMPGTIEDRANALAQYLSRDNRSATIVERIDGSIVHFVRSVLIEDFDTWRLNGYMGDPYREVRQRFKVEMDPSAPMSFEWKEI